MSAELVKVIVRCRPTNTIEQDRRSKVTVYFIGFLGEID